MGGVIVVLKVLTFTLLFATVVGCVLVAVSSVIGQAGRMTIRGSCKTSRAGVRDVILSRALMRVIYSVVIDVFLVFLYQSVVCSLLSISIRALLLSGKTLMLLKIYIVIFLIANLIPNYLFTHVPITTTFHGFHRDHHI